MILISGATVLAADGVHEADVLLEGERVAAIGKRGVPAGAQVIDGTGMVLGPGLVDLHVHLREPGHTWKEDVETGSRAAARGGFTAVVAMPNTSPPIDTPELAERVHRRGAEVGLVEVRSAGALTRQRAGQEVGDLHGLYEAGVRIFSDDGDTVGDIGVARKAMSILAGLPGAVFAEHAEDPSLALGGHLHEGALADEYGLQGLPSRAEEVIVERDLALAAGTGAHVHIQHVSAAGSVALIKEARAKGSRVTAEVTPHHLALVVEDVRAGGADFKMYPPLRLESDRRALVGALRDGTIDAVATDHAPHTPREKAAGFEGAPRGVIGLETAVPIALEALGGDVLALFSAMSIRPARIAGMADQGRSLAPGDVANLVLIDPNARWHVDSFASRSSNTPFRDRALIGRVAATFFEGRQTHGETE